jgi:hypothetical protein
MSTIKILILISLTLAVGLFAFNCATETKTVAPKQEQITKNMVPAKTEVTGPAFCVELNEMKLVTTVDTTSKEITETPNLRGKIKITNKSKDMLDIQAVTLEYLDDGGKPIAYKSDEKVATVYPFWKSLQPDGIAEGSLDITVPMNAIKNNSLRKLAINVVYVPSPLKREILTLSQKVE